MEKQTRRLVATSAAALLLAAVAAEPAAAASTKVYPGMSCRPMGNDIADVTEAGTLTSRTATGVSPYNDFFLQIVCPIEKENPSSGLLSVEVTVYDHSVYQDFKCQVKKVVPRASAPVVFGSSEKTTSGASDMPQTMRIGPRPNTNPQAHWFLECGFPGNCTHRNHVVLDRCDAFSAQSQIVSYTVTEE